MKIYRLFIFLLTFTLLSGCAAGPDFKPPVVEAPAQYRAEPVPHKVLSELNWWELFQDPVLYELVTEALENNKDVNIAVSRIAEARARLGFTEADLLPRIDIEAGINTGSFAGGGYSPDRITNAFAAPVLKWEIDFWGKFRRQTESARAELLATDYGLRTIQLALISEVVSTYYALLDFRNRLEISQRTLKSREASLDIIQQRLDEYRLCLIRRIGCNEKYATDTDLSPRTVYQLY